MDDLVETLTTGLTVHRREGGGLRLCICAGADGLGDARELTMPLQDAHLEVLREDLPRQVLLTGSLVAQCCAAGVMRPLDQAAARDQLELLLEGSPQEIDAQWQGDHSAAQQLIAFGADPELYGRGEVFAAVQTVTADPDWRRVRLYEAHKRHAARGSTLSDLDIAVLQYTGAIRGTATHRRPDDVDPSLLPQAERVISAAERGLAGGRSRNGHEGGLRGRVLARSLLRGFFDLSEWQERKDRRNIRAAVLRHHPDLAEEALRAVCELVRYEAAATRRER